MCQDLEIWGVLMTPLFALGVFMEPGRPTLREVDLALRAKTAVAHLALSPWLFLGAFCIDLEGATDRE